MESAIPGLKPAALPHEAERTGGSSAPGITQPTSFDLSQTLWLNLLAVEGKSVFWWDKEIDAAAEVLRERGCKLLACVASPTESTVRQGIHCVQSASALEKGSMDIAFVNLGSSSDSGLPPGTIGAAIADISSMLKADGLVIVAIPRGLKSVPSRLKAARALKRAGFKHREFYWQDSRPGYHRAIIPLSEDPRWAIQYLTSPATHRHPGIVGCLKRSVKKLLYHITGICNPRYSLLVLGRKNSVESVPGALSPFEQTRTITSRLTGQREPAAVLLWSRPYSGKQHLFGFDPRNHELLAVREVSIHAQDPGGLGRQSYENMQLISPLADEFARHGIGIPALLEGRETGSMTDFVRSSIAGENIDSLIQSSLRRDDRGQIAHLVREALDLQALTQDLLTHHLRDRARRIEDRYFENYLNLQMEDYRRLEPAGAAMVQHGDFAPVNLLRDGPGGKWGLIDWEWMRASYPPLYDTFTFFLRVHFLANRRTGLTRHQELVDSVMDSFFNSNWFSQLVHDQAMSYCNRYHIPRQDVFSHFIRFLLFQCGRYRYAITGHPAALASYEEILKWSIRHQERFVCQ